MKIEKKIELIEKEIAELKEELTKQNTEKFLANLKPQKDDDY